VDENECSSAIIGAAIEVHRQIGPGLLESAYEAALAHELSLRQLRFQRQVVLPIIYKGLQVTDAYRIDLLVENTVVVEVKAIDRIAPIHEVQLLTYLRFSNRRLGLLLNFHATPLREGIRRIANKL
jgi:GxxExxY protein